MKAHKGKTMALGMGLGVLLLAGFALWNWEGIRAWYIGYRFIWTGDGIIPDALNASGDVAVNRPFDGHATEAGLWTLAERRFVSLGTLPDGDSRTRASAINDRGSILGNMHRGGNHLARAFLWSREGGMRELETLGGQQIAAIDLNNKDQVVGWSQRARKVPDLAILRFLRGNSIMHAPSARPSATAVPALVLLACMPVFAGKENGELDIYWIDVEGGAATLIVTPAGESVLVDTGMPGERDPGRIVKAVREVAKLERIDHLVVTHFDIDHYGGVADLSKKIEIGRVYDPGLPEDNRRLMERLGPYIAATEKKRTVPRPGDSLPLREARREGAQPMRLALRCLAANQKFIAPPAGAAENPVCADHEPREKDLSQNANSIVLLLEFGPFRFLDGGDLTWNLEKELACPHDLVGEVDVYQSDHHGLDQSNNPVLVRTVKPTVAIINNGPRKGCEPKTFELLSKNAKAVYQGHRNVRTGPQGNTATQRIANDDEACKAEIIHLAVERTGLQYSVTIPSKGTREAYEVKLAKNLTSREADKAAETQSQTKTETEKKPAE